MTSHADNSVEHLEKNDFWLLTKVSGGHCFLFCFQEATRPAREDVRRILKLQTCMVKGLDG